MQTLQFDLARDEWTEILGGNNSLYVQVVTAGGIAIHLNDSGTAPASDAPFVRVPSYPERWDFEAVTQTGQSRIWARGENGDARIVVIRKTT